jgi:hypothetical protein
VSQVTAARLGFAALLLAALIAAIAVAGVRLDWLGYPLGWRLMFPATGLGLIAFALSFTWLGAALKANDGAGRRFGLITLVGSLLLLWPPLSTWFHRLTSPPIFDFTTDTENPPRFAVLLKQRGPADNPPGYDGNAAVSFEGKTVTLSEVLHDHYRLILKPQTGFAVGSKDPRATFFQRDLAAARKTGWTIVAADAGSARIEATHASFWFGRISDIVILARNAGAGARTDLRSQSRSDKIDDGFNAANAKYFFSLVAH